ncbi:Gfo/Idh/MocA family oxidoreductase [Catenovulum sediminis]|uniref:Gfo/Idh/MocA family oxidoreductase n=1 Tax=Catenovulum sediminis TaxID=1740262 RepID=UPI00163DCB64
MSLGLIGPGRIAHRFAQALSADFVGKLQAVASRNEARARQFASQYNCSTIYTQYENLYEAKDIDAIYIATPHNFHYEQIKAGLTAGKSVLCEKPLTVTSAQASELFTLAKKQGVFLMEAMWSLYLPAYQQVNEWIGQGQIGELKLVRSTFGYNTPKDPTDRLLNPELAGGVLLDMGVYCVATAQWLMQEQAQTISAIGQIGETGVDELTMANLGYSGQRFAQFTSNFHCQTENTLDIYGSEGRIHLPNMFWQPQQVTLIKQNSELTVRKPFAVNGFEYEIAEAEKCITQGMLESSVVTHQFTHNCLQTMESILQQVKE